MSEHECIQQEHLLKETAKLQEMEFDYSLLKTEMTSRLDAHGQGIREIGLQMSEIKDSLVGTLKEPGLIPRTTKLIDDFGDHLKESERFRPMIEENHRICSKISDSIGLTFNSILRTFAQSVATSTILGITWLLINKN